MINVKSQNHGSNVKNVMSKQEIPDQISVVLATESVRNDRAGMIAVRGFTLIELMISMVVFAIFITVMFSTYLFVASASRDANEERKAIEEAQFLLDEMVRTVRAGTVDYSCYDAADVCGVLNADGRVDGILAVRLKATGERVLFQKDAESALTILYQKKSNAGEWQNSSSPKKLSHEKITVERLDFLITPSADPYTHVVDNQFQYQSRVSIFMEIQAPARSRPDGIRIPAQTTVSSRFYNRL
ncbi:type II secretion system protein [Candidatus Peregrinibacteria bacterium]|nr:type II secretion system protein [Candidatus Peregrinibacteria bacterium]